MSLVRSFFLGSLFFIGFMSVNASACLPYKVLTFKQNAAPYYSLHLKAQGGFQRNRYQASIVKANGETLLSFYNCHNEESAWGYRTGDYNISCKRGGNKLHIFGSEESGMGVSAVWEKEEGSFIDFSL